MQLCYFRSFFEQKIPNRQGKLGAVDKLLVSFWQGVGRCLKQAKILALRDLRDGRLSRQLTALRGVPDRGSLGVKLPATRLN